MAPSTDERHGLPVGPAASPALPQGLAGAAAAAAGLARYAWAARMVAGRRVLDAGCGTGEGAAILLDAGATEVVGVDLAAAVLEVARDPRRPALVWRQADIGSLPFDDAGFDAVVCFDVLEDVEDPVRATAELARVTAADGVLALSWSPRGGPTSGARTLAELRGVLGETFEEVRELRQGDLLSAAVLADSGAPAAGTPLGAELEPVEVRRCALGEGGLSTVVLLAGRRDSPRPGSLVLLGDDVDRRAWTEHSAAQARRLAELGDELVALRSALAERSLLQRELVEAETRIGQLAAVAADARERVRELDELRDRLDASLGQRGRELLEVIAQRDALTAETAALDRERGELRIAAARLERLEASRSWRLTAPLRRAGQALRSRSRR